MDYVSQGRQSVFSLRQPTKCFVECGLCIHQPRQPVCVQLNTAHQLFLLIYTILVCVVRLQYCDITMMFTAEHFKNCKYAYLSAWPTMIFTHIAQVKLILHVCSQHLFNLVQLYVRGLQALLLCMHLSVVCHTTHTWGLCGKMVGDLYSKSHPRGRALSHPSQKKQLKTMFTCTVSKGQEAWLNCSWYCEGFPVLKGWRLLHGANPSMPVVYWGIPLTGLLLTDWSWGVTQQKRKGPDEKRRRWGRG